MIPGVLQYGFIFFCLKFAVYAILLWLPMFLTKELQYKNDEIPPMVTSFETGNLLGGITLGFISDYFYAKRAPVGFAAVLISFCICFTLTFTYDFIKPWLFGFQLFLLGLLLGGMHHIVCVTCSADLGARSKATSTVTGIIDGMGSLGTSIG
jgi:sugar phosphate permease